MSREAIESTRLREFIPVSLNDAEGAIITGMSEIGGVLVHLYVIPNDMLDREIGNGPAHVLLWDLPRLSRIFFPRCPTVRTFLPLHWVVAGTANGAWIQVVIPATAADQRRDPELPIAGKLARDIEGVYESVLEQLRPDGVRLP